MVDTLLPMILKIAPEMRFDISFTLLFYFNFPKCGGHAILKHLNILQLRISLQSQIQRCHGFGMLSEI